MGEQAQYVYIEDVWSYPLQNVHWRWPNAGFIEIGTNERFAAPTDKTDDAYYEWKLTQFSCLTAPGHEPEEIFPSAVVRTQEEMDRYSRLYTQIKTYHEENMLRFASGDRPLSEWDDYIAEFEQLGLAEYLELQQAAYDRTTGKQ